MESVKVRDLKNKKSVLQWATMEKERVLMIFTTTCPACQANQETWRTLYQQAGEQFEFIGVSLDNLAASKAYRDAKALPFPVVVPEDRESFTRAYEVSAVPLTIRVGRDGRVRNTWLGGLPERAVADLLATNDAGGMNQI